MNPFDLSRTIKNLEMKTCPNCNVKIKVTAKFCPKCGKKLPQETYSPSSKQEIIDVDFTKERASLERAIQIFDGIFADQTLRSRTNPNLWDTKKTWYLNQKQRFLQRNVSNEMFYGQLKSLHEYLRSTVKISEDRLSLGEETYSPSKIDEEELSMNVTEKLYDQKNEQCWTCGKIVKEDSRYLHFCSKTCENAYNPYEVQREALSSSISGPVEVSKEAKLDQQELEITDDLKTLEFSPLAGRIAYLLRQLETKPTLSLETIEVVNKFRYHQDNEIRAIVKRLNEKRREGKIQIRGPYPLITPTVIKKPSVQKEIPEIEPRLSREIVPQELVKPPDLLLPKSLLEMPKPERSESVVTLDSEPSKAAITVTPPTEPVSEEKQSLFSSIEYQVQDMIFEQGDTGPIVLIIPYSGSIKEIKVNFDKNQIIMSGCLKRQNLPLANLELQINGEPRQPSWDDPWQDITLSGEEKILKQIKLRSEIADRLTSLGTALIKVESQTKGEICIQLTCTEAKEAIKHAYSLIKDLQLFFEISFY